MKVLLVATNTLMEPYPVYPLGLDYVAAAISGKHQVCISDLNGATGYEGLKAAIHTFSPDIIGLSLRNIDNTDALNPNVFYGHGLHTELWHIAQSGIPPIDVLRMATAEAAAAAAPVFPRPVFPPPEADAAAAFFLAAVAVAGGEVEIEEEEEEEINQLYLIERRIEAMEKTLKRIERKLGDDD